MKAKANITPAIGELIQIASEKAQYPDYNNKHGAKAQFGWYRYNTRFGIPVYDEDGNLITNLYDEDGNALTAGSQIVVKHVAGVFLKCQ